MKDKQAPCIYYTNAHGTCDKGYIDVTLDKCSHCKKYRGRKMNVRPESIKLKRFKEREKMERKEYG